MKSTFTLIVCISASVQGVPDNNDYNKDQEDRIIIIGIMEDMDFT